MQTLEQLRKQVDSSHDKAFPHHKLRPIHGAGKTYRPKIMFVFINPTARNASTSKEWRGPRYPFIGTKHIWRIFHKAGLFDAALLAEIEDTSIWSLDLTKRVQESLTAKDIYITNIVKWAGHDATLPDREKIKLFLPFLEKEIAIVKPKVIITFGLIPFEGLSGEKIKLIDYYTHCIKTQKLKTFTTAYGPIIPCYFPIGRGDPKRAVELLKLTTSL